MARSKSKSGKREPPRRSYDAEATRRRLLDAAGEEFARRGFSGARVETIARKAGANKAMIYLYFDSKAGLYRQTFLENFRKVAEQEDLLNLSEADLPRLTETLIETYFDFHERHPDFWRFVAWANLAPEAGPDPGELAGISGAVLGHLRKLYERGRKIGLFREDVSFHAYIFAVMSASFFYRGNLATMSGTLNRDLSQPRHRRALVRELARMFERGIRNDSLAEKEQTS